MLWLILADSTPGTTPGLNKEKCCAEVCER